MIRSAFQFAARAAREAYRSTPWAWAADAIVATIIAAIWWLR